MVRASVVAAVALVAATSALAALSSGPRSARDPLVAALCDAAAEPSSLCALLAASAEVRDAADHPAVLHAGLSHFASALARRVDAAYSLDAALAARRTELQQHGAAGGTAPDFFQFIPHLVAQVQPTTAPRAQYAAPASRCFDAVDVVAVWDNTTSTADSGVGVDVKYNATRAAATASCTEVGFLYTSIGVDFVVLHAAAGATTATHTAALRAGLPLGETHSWFLRRHGVYLFSFPSDPWHMLGSIVDTLLLLEPALAKSVPIPAWGMALSEAFIARVIQQSPDMQPRIAPRSAGTAVLRNATFQATLRSGDALFITRLDGQHPLLSWMIGSTAPHTAVVMRISDDDLRVCHAIDTALEFAFHRNGTGLRCMPYDAWADGIERGEFVVVLAPLKPSLSAAFNTTAAMAFFAMVDGYAYGVPSMFMEWIDTATANFPCQAPGDTSCVSEPLFGFLIVLLDLVKGNELSNPFRQALNLRVGTVNASILAVWMRADTALGMSLADVYTTPERDTNRYRIRRDGLVVASGPSLVCSTFVCSMWRAGGVFAGRSVHGNISCTEQQVWDIFSMDVFDTARFGANRPAACVATDPSQPLCQLAGAVTFPLRPMFNERRLYPQMGNDCPSHPPNYSRPAGC